MKYFIIVLIMTGFLTAIEMPVSTGHRCNKVEIDDGSLYKKPSHNIVQQYTIVDSSIGSTTLTLQNHECISYEPSADAIAIVNRAFANSGDLNVHSAPGDLSFWLHDYVVYSSWYGFGPARYPTAIAGTTGPYISFPYLIATWGGAGAVYGSGGWFSSIWDDPVDLGPGDVRTQTCIGKELPNGNMCFILYCVDPWGLMYRTYSSDLSTLIDSGWVTPPDRYYWGWDCNITAGIAYVFYVDTLYNVYYKTTTDGVTWSAEQTYNLVWPDPFTNNLVDLSSSFQTAVRDNGEPILVLDQRDGDDGTYPQYSKVYVSHTEGEPCVEVSAAFPDSECFYPTIATGGDTVAVVFNMPRNNINDSLCWQDIYINWSFDNGQTWGTPENLTTWSTKRTSLPQLAKRLDVTRNRAYIVYPTCRLAEEDMDLWWAYGGSSPSLYVNFMYAETEPGIEEDKTEPPMKMSLNLFPNPVMNYLNITFALPAASNISLKLFSADGRLVKTIDRGHKSAGVYMTNLSTSELANGTYFLILETEEKKISRSIVVVH